MAGILREALREEAFQEFEAEFTRNGYGKAPEGLMKLLKEFALRPEETPDEGRARLYKRLWCLLWFGSGKTLGALPDAGGRSPTYVFPSTLKRIVRLVVPGNLVDKQDPSNERIYNVTIGDLSAAKWPASRKGSRR